MKPRIYKLTLPGPFQLDSPWVYDDGNYGQHFATYEEAVQAAIPPKVPDGYMELAEKLERYKGDIKGAESDKPLNISLAPAENLAEANLIASKIRGSETRHILALDIDHPSMLVPSSTPGHFHLYIDKEMSWPQLELALDALAYAGIIEAGFKDASISRRQTNLRTPWEKK